MREENWRKKQRKELWFIITLTFDELNEPKADYWKHTLFHYFCHRFYRHTRGSWIDFMADFNDTMAYGKYVQPKTQYFCVKIRDKAIEIREKLNKEKEQQNVIRLSSGEQRKRRNKETTRSDGRAS